MRDKGWGGVDEGALCSIHFTLGSSLSRGKSSQRIKQLNKVEKLLLRLKRLRRGQIALLGLVLIVDLFDLATIDAQAARWQDLAHHFLSHPPKPRLSRLLRLQDERQVEHLRQHKQALGEAETIGV